MRNYTAWYGWYTFLVGHPETMVAFSSIGISTFKITWDNYYWFLKSIFQNETSYLFKMIITISPIFGVSDLSNSLYSWRSCVFYHNFEIHVSNQMNQKYKIWPALLVFHFLWVHQVSPKNILLSIIKGWNALSKSWSLSLLSCAGVKLLINSLKDLLFDSLKTKLSPVLPKLMSSVS